MQKVKKESKTIAFFQHGYFKKGTSGDQEYGTCPFCGNQKHKHSSTFYINVNTLQWDCKSCGREGGFQSFLREMSLHCKQHFKGNAAISLTKSRGITLKTLRKFNVGYNPITKNYVIPVNDVQDEKVWDLRIYDGASCRSTKGCKSPLLGWQKTQTDYHDVYICEGEWDMMAMTELQDNIKFEGIIVGLPGAGNLKPEWTSFFDRKNVIGLYDNDAPGRKGAAKCFKLLSSTAETLQFLQWKKAGKFKDKYDIRDYYIAHGSKTLTFILDNLAKELPGLEIIQAKDSKTNEPKKEVFDGDGMDYKDVYAAYTKWLKLEDLNIIDVCFGTVIANRIPGTPVWMFLTGPSGATKSEMILSLSRTKQIISTSTISGPALVSGSNSSGFSDPSLLRILNNRFLCIKDFTTLLSANPLAREEVIGILRDAFDGCVIRSFGNGVKRHYEPCFFGILAGVTGIIEVFSEEHVALGERFIRYNVTVPETIEDMRELLRRAMSNTSQENEMQGFLKETAAKCLNYAFKEEPDVPEEMAEKIRTLGIWTSELRATVLRDKYSKDILFQAMKELPTRITKQFLRLAIGICKFRRIPVATEEIYSIIKKSALDTVPSRLGHVIKAIYDTDPYESYSADTLAEQIKLPRNTTQRVIENLLMSNLLEKKKGGKFNHRVMLTDQAHELIEHGNLYQKPEKKKNKIIIPLRRLK